MSVAQAIARFAVGLRYEDLTPASVHEVGRRVIDSLGCAMGAWTAEPVEIARRLACGVTGERGATVFGTRHRSTPEAAAFANGAAIRYLDFNDTYLSLEPAHPSDNLAAVFAIADAFGLRGRSVILGAVVAYEVQCRLCDAYSIRSRGWDHVTYGAYSTVAGCGAMLGFDEATMVHALGLAGVPNNAMRQTRVGELSMWKGCAFANAARNGVFATLLAHHGMTGPSGVFEGPMGFFQEVCGGDGFRLDEWGSRADGYAIERTYIKKWPAEYHSQSAVDAALDIVRSHGGTFKPDAVADVEIATFTASWEIIGSEPEKWRPESRETADHSLPYIACAALVDGTVGLSTFDESRFRDERLLSLVAKTRVVADPELDAVYPSGGIPNRLTVRLHDGSTWVSRVDAPAGHALNPMSDDAVEAKFRSMAEPRLGAEAAGRAIDAAWRLDGAEGLGDLFAAVVV